MSKLCPVCWLKPVFSSFRSFRRNLSVYLSNYFQFTFSGKLQKREDLENLLTYYTLYYTVYYTLYHYTPLCHYTPKTPKKRV